MMFVILQRMTSMQAVRIAQLDNDAVNKDAKIEQLERGAVEKDGNVKYLNDRIKLLELRQAAARQAAAPQAAAPLDYKKVLLPIRRISAELKGVSDREKSVLATTSTKNRIKKDVETFVQAVMSPGKAADDCTANIFSGLEDVINKAQLFFAERKLSVLCAGCREQPCEKCKKTPKMSGGGQAKRGKKNDRNDDDSEDDGGEIDHNRLHQLRTHGFVLDPF